MPRIGIITELKTTYEAALKASQFYDDCARVVKVYSYDEGISEAKQMALDGVRILITRAGYSVRLREANLSIPVIDIPFTSNSVMGTLSEAKRKYSEFAFIGDAAAIETARSLEGAIGPGMRYYEVHTVDDFAASAAKAKADGMEAAAGGFDETRYVAQLGMERFIVTSHTDDISASLREARKMLEQVDNEAHRNEQLRTLLDMLPDGLVMIDAKGCITHINQKGGHILGLPPDQAVGKRIPNYALENGVKAVLESKKTALYDLLELDTAKFSYTIQPVLLEGIVSGAIVLLQEVEYVRNVEQRIRTQLAQRGLVAVHSFDDILGENETIRQTIHRAKQFAVVDSTVLINGESGTGKEMFAQSIHNYSLRRDGPFVAVNCATLPPNLLESELFGYAEGAFTGAKKSGKMGLFELAHRGTIFLDEIGESDLRMQARLLRVLEERQIMRIGDDRIVPVDVRVIAATNRSLAGMVAEGAFREDFYYRLNVLSLRLPPLRERKDDLSLLIRCFTEKYMSRHGRGGLFITPDGMEALTCYDWPGNARELKNAIERLVITSDGSPVGRAEIAELLGLAAPQQRAVSGLLEENEQEAILRVLQSVGGNKSAAAAALGISRPTLYRKLRALEQS
ncbi:MAG: PAS domain-containing protein [Clostridia bacterium]|nr:PAS domain-containing protein [Clostridia bacterium]